MNDDQTSFDAILNSGGIARNTAVTQISHAGKSLILIARADRSLLQHDAEITAILGRKLAPGDIVFHQGTEVARVDHDRPIGRRQ